MAEETGETPVLLLDEVVAELDEQRRALLLRYIQRGAQAILTATDPAMFTEAFLQQANALHVSNGRISRSDGITLQASDGAPGSPGREVE